MFTYFTFVSWFFAEFQNLPDVVSTAFHQLHSTEQIGNYRIAAHRIDFIRAALLNRLTTIHSAGRVNLQVIIVHINMDFSA